MRASSNASIWLKAASGAVAAAALSFTPASAHGHQEMNQKEAAESMHKSCCMRVHDSASDFETTLDQLRAAIDARGFRTFAVIDHAAGAATVDVPLRPTTLVIFGNPKGGAPLMAAAQTLGFALPLRALVYETEDGAVKIGTTDIKHVLEKHGVDAPKRADAIAGAIASIVEDAAR